jgi:hypothetical protein
MWHFVKGRQAGGYEKMGLVTARWPIPSDIYIIRFKTGTSIPKHRDVVSNGKHYRLNIVLWPFYQGGRFVCNKTIILVGPVVLFRPDLEEHSLTEITKGMLYLLSFVFVRNSG